MAESIVLEDLKKGNKERQCRYFKMKVNESEKAEVIQELVEKYVSWKAVVFSDNSKAYTRIHKVVEEHRIENSKDTYLTRILRWVSPVFNKKSVIGSHT